MRNLPDVKLAPLMLVRWFSSHPDGRVPELPKPPPLGRPRPGIGGLPPADRNEKPWPPKKKPARSRKEAINPVQELVTTEARPSPARRRVPKAKGKRKTGS